MMDEESFRIVRGQPLFSGLEPSLFDSLVAGAQPRTYPKGRLLFQRGDPADHFYIIFDGWVKLYRDTPNGDHVVLGVFSRGDMFAEAAAFVGTGYPASAEIIEDAKLLAVETKRFISVVESHPSASLNMLASMSRHLHRLVYEVERLKTRSASQRLVEFLLRRCQVMDGPAVIDLPYDKNLIAARLGVQPESLSRLLNKLRDYGVETNANRVLVADVARLREYCPVDEQEHEERTVA
tara:strand:- start:12258 stop:12968 length:711 start_codon:yes stop_codon:yes gene_type:complete